MVHKHIQHTQNVLVKVLMLVDGNFTVEIQRKRNIPLANVTVDSSVSIVYKYPSYLIFALETRLILLPMYGVPLALISNSFTASFEW